MQHIKFIDSVVRNIKAPERGQVTYWAEGVPGFGLRVGVSGNKSFISKVNQAGKAKFFTHGRYPATTIRDARVKHDELCKLIEHGRDIMDIKDAPRSDSTISDSYEEFLVDREKSGYSGQRRERTMFRTKICQDRLGNKRISDIRDVDLTAFIDRVLTDIRSRSQDKKGAGISQAKHLAVLLRTFFVWATRKGMIKDNPAKDLKVDGRTRARERILHPVEIWRLWNGLEAVQNSSDAALRLMLATMQRSQEVRYLKWSEIDDLSRVWTIADTTAKNRTTHRVPLNRFAIDQLNIIKKRVGEVGDFVFYGDRPLHDAALSRAFAVVRDRLGMGDVTPHDLRRTGATYLAAVGLPALYASLMLNHKQRGVTAQVYIQYSYDFEKRRAADVWEFILAQILQAKSEKDVPSLDHLRELVRERGLV